MVLSDKFKWPVLLIFAIICQISPAQTFTPEELSKIDFVESLSSVGDYNYFNAKEKNDIDSAIIWLESIETDTRFEKYQIWFYYHRGRLYLVQKKIEKSKADLEMAIMLDSMNYEVMDRICVLSSHLKNYTNRNKFIKKGIKGYRHKLDLDSSNAADWYYYAKFLDLLSNYSSTYNIVKERYAYNKCVTLEPTNPDYWYELSVCYTTTDPEKSIRYMEEALKYKESTYYRSHIIAEITQWIKDKQRGIDYITFCINLYKNKYPENTWYLKLLYNWRADIYKEMGNLKLRSADIKTANSIK